MAEFTAKRYQNNSTYPIRFDKLRPGSLFKISAERSRGHTFSKDQRVYRRALLEEGFYAVNIANDQPACLMPEDLVQPVREVR